jgi:prepilin-type N-terminal cleavage/methylation domain-containing protein/prepilin-type processing-associated H-X9-DG protein
VEIHKPMQRNFSFPAKRGFTLIELLTVIAIIGILAAILIPVVGKVREQAKMAQCAVHLRDLGTAVHLYANDKNDWLPPFFHQPNPAPEWGSQVNIHGHIGLLLAPEKGGVRLGSGLERWSGDYLDTPEPLMCPALPEEIYNSGPSPRYIRASEIRANNPILRVGYLFFYRPPGNAKENAMATTDFPNRPYVLDFPLPGTSGLGGNFPVPGHQGRVNVLHVGGHVTSFTAEELRRIPAAPNGANLFDHLAGERRW